MNYTHLKRIKIVACATIIATAPTTNVTEVDAQISIEQMIIDQWSNNGYPQYAQLAVRVMRCESGLNPNARNRSGAAGLAQLMPVHWRKKFNPYDPAKNIEKAFYLFRPAKGKVGFDKHWKASKRCWR